MPLPLPRPRPHPLPLPVAGALPPGRSPGEAGAGEGVAPAALVGEGDEGGAEGLHAGGRDLQEVLLPRGDREVQEVAVALVLPPRRHARQHAARHVRAALQPRQLREGHRTGEAHGERARRLRLRLRLLCVCSCCCCRRLGAAWRAPPPLRARRLVAMARAARP
eukprot:scaffold2602_cov292-Prasinococcus_capsulatus_cf.AAC.2